MDWQQIQQRVAAARAAMKAPAAPPSNPLPRTNAGVLPKWRGPTPVYYDGMTAHVFPPPGMQHEECQPRADHEGDFVLPIGMDAEVELLNPAFAGMPCTVAVVFRGRAEVNPARGLEMLPMCTPRVNGIEIGRGEVFSTVFRGPLDARGAVTMPLRFNDDLGLLRGGENTWRAYAGARAVRALLQLHGPRVMTADCYEIEVRLMVNGIGWSQVFAICAAAPFLPAANALRADSASLDLASSDMETDDELDATFVPDGGLPNH